MPFPVNLALSQNLEQQYRIEKRRLHVSVALLGGEIVRGHIFLQPSPYGHLGHEAPIDVLNAAEPFFPIQLDDESVLLVAKEHVVEMFDMEPLDRDALMLASTHRATLEVRLASGVMREGSMNLEMPADRPRVLDFLNTSKERFFELTCHGRAHLLNQTLVHTVRPVD
jgi:hypothetical protein